MTRSVTDPRSMDTRMRLAFRPLAEGLESRQLLTAGDLDLSFGNGGSVLVSPRIESQAAGYFNDQAFGGVEVQSNGSILVAGSSSKTTSAWGVVRLTPSGALDPSYGSGGRVLTTFTNQDSQDKPYETALQADGKLVVVGVVSNRTTVGRTTVSNDDFGVVRYLTNGTLDPSFGSGGTGKLTTNVSSYQSTNGLNQRDFAGAVALQTDG